MTAAKVLHGGLNDLFHGYTDATSGDSGISLQATVCKAPGGIFASTVAKVSKASRSAANE